MSKAGHVPQRRVLSVLRGKINSLHYSYSGSWDIPVDWLEMSGILPFQKIALINPKAKDSLRERTVYTYVLPTPRGSACMNANGGIAHYFEAGGEVIIQSYGTFMDKERFLSQSPVFLDARESPVFNSTESSVASPIAYADWMDFVAGKLHFAVVNTVIESPERIAGDMDRAQAILAYLKKYPAMQVLGQPVCVLSQDMADYVGFESFEAISLYPANGNQRFNHSVMCWVIPAPERSFAMMGEGISAVISPGDRMVACRYTSLSPDQIYNHTAKVHILDQENMSQSEVDYRMADYLAPDLRWIV